MDGQETAKVVEHSDAKLGCSADIVTLLGTCLEMLNNGDLCGEIDSLVFLSITTLASSTDTPVKEATMSDHRKFSARAPPVGLVMSAGTHGSSMGIPVGILTSIKPMSHSYS